MFYEDPQQLAQLSINFCFGLDRPPHLSPKYLAILGPEACDLAANGGLSDGKPRRQLRIRGKGIGTNREEPAKALEQVLLALRVVSCRQSAQRCRDDRLRPGAFEQPVLRERAAVGRTLGLEERLRLFGSSLIKGQKVAVASALECLLALSRVGEKILQRSEEERAEFPLISIGTHMDFVFDQMREKPLREILCVMHRITMTPHIVVERRPVGLA